MSERVCKKCGRLMRKFEIIPKLKGLTWCWYLFCPEYNKKIKIEEKHNKLVKTLIQRYIPIIKTKLFPDPVMEMEIMHEEGKLLIIEEVNT